MPKNAPFAKGKRVCVFCEGKSGARISGEHLWPEWAAPFLPSSPTYTNRVSTREWEKIADVKREWTRSGAVKNVKIRAVCEFCNSGWMSILETAVRSTLSAMMIGNPMVLGEAQQETLAAWLTMKLMVAEYNESENAVFTQNQRSAFHVSRQIPTNFQIYLMDCPNPAPAYRSTADTMFSRDGFDPTFSGKNIKTVTISFGRLVAFAFVSTEIEIDFNLTPPHKFVRLIPSSRHTIAWPPVTQASRETVDRLMGVLDDIKRSPNFTIIPPGG